MYILQALIIVGAPESSLGGLGLYAKLIENLNKTWANHTNPIDWLYKERPCVVNKIGMIGMEIWLVFYQFYVETYASYSYSVRSYDYKGLQSR